MAKSSGEGLTVESSKVSMNVPRQMPDTVATAVMGATADAVDSGMKVVVVSMFALQFYFSGLFKKVIGSLLSL